MKKDVTFSIIVCAYNVEDYIERAIESINNQNFIDYEIIIVNDGSTDNTYAKIKKIKLKNNRIKIINNRKNIGLGASRNIAVDKAKGKYVLYLDSDDTIYNEDTLNKVNNIIENEAPDLIYMGVQYIGGSNKQYIPNAENSTREARIACDMHFAVSSKCFKRQFLLNNNISFLTDTYYEDMLYSIQCTILAPKITYGTFPFYNYYRNREGSIMSTPSIRRCTDMYKIMDYIMGLYEMTPDKYKPYLMSFIKNETNSITNRMDIILEAIKNHSNAPVLPKRDYKFIRQVEVEQYDANQNYIS